MTLLSVKQSPLNSIMKAHREKSKILLRREKNTSSQQPLFQSLIFATKACSTLTKNKRFEQNPTQDREGNAKRMWTTKEFPFRMDYNKKGATASHGHMKAQSSKRNTPLSWSFNRV